MFVIAIFAMTSLLATATAIYTATDNGSNVKAATVAECNVSINSGIKLTEKERYVIANLTVTGSNANCNKYATLAVWKSRTASGQPLSQQTLYGSDTKKMSVGNHRLVVAVPECSYWQADLLGQANPRSINGDANYVYPHDKLADFMLGGKKCNTPPPPVDVCPNIDGMQSEVPAGYVKDANGNCVATPPPPVDTDVCPNIDGMQDKIPDGYVKDENGNCVVITTDTDVCPNIDGMQKEVPAGYERDQDGNCVLKTKPVTPATTTPVGKGGPLPDTGPGDIVGLFLASTFAGSLAYKFVWLKRFI